MSESDELLAAILEIRDLVRLMAEPAVAERDRNFRAELKRIVGRSAAKAASVFLMNGSRLQAEIRRETNINQGDLSTLVKALNDRKLLVGDGKKPKLAISIPSKFFQTEDTDE